MCLPHEASDVPCVPPYCLQWNEFSMRITRSHCVGNHCAVKIPRSDTVRNIGKLSRLWINVHWNWTIAWIHFACYIFFFSARHPKRFTNVQHPSDKCTTAILHQDTQPHTSQVGSEGINQSVSFAWTGHFLNCVSQLAITKFDATMDFFFIPFCSWNQNQKIFLHHLMNVILTNVLFVYYLCSFYCMFSLVLSLCW